MKLSEGWVPVALSSSIEAGTSAGAIAQGSEIVVWRDSSGKAHVWEDRCPHRGMRMSFGFVRGDHIACLYHGWQYDTAGQCRYIPAHPTLDVPQTIKVPTYLAQEKYGIVWATTDEASVMPNMDAPEVTPVRSLYVDRSVEDVRDAFVRAGMTALAAEPGRLALGDDVLLIGLQEMHDTKTAAHIVILGAPAIYGGDKQKHYAQWAERLRYALEQSRTAEVA
ncbi:Rieske 2Fe-2S domain-containing protein [Rhizobium sp. 2MFCol3.1]|uniref:Rieske 2Fe-2S domain-containing protein n=1 Tax=Rhizobium sp. 2MFCol3.1 TaxID=1246459 RepID=UPI00036E7B2B|nr:Rieske 2Fe-2S domain-containing protein [Rhizobium sp. 2MFCol3.1]